MKKTLLMVATVGILFVGCGEKQPAPSNSPDFQCKQENVLAPKWTCVPEYKDSYAAVGFANKSSAGYGHMRKVAVADGRSNLAQEIQTEVKDKVESFTRSTGIGKNETVDKVTTAVSKQVAKVTLNGSKVVDTWNSPSGNLFVLVAVDKNKVNEDVKSTIKTSFKNDNALWQQFQSKNALEKLDKEFPSN